MIVDHQLSSLYEWFADLTLSFGLLPNADISVVGVGWFLGTVFAFYMLFPFFTFLIGNKKRAWIVLSICIVLNILCQVYFLDVNHVVDGFRKNANLVYSSMFFVAGGMLYLYRVELKKLLRLKWVVLTITVFILVFYYAVNSSVFTILFLFTLFMIFGICAVGGEKVIFQNKIVHFLSGVSMEIYLCHMFVYRLLEKLKLVHLTGNEIVNYIVVSVVTILGTVIISLAWKQVVIVIQGFINKKVKGRNYE